MTDRVNISNKPERAVCKTICWLIGGALGGYLAFVLVKDFGQAQVQAGVLGIVTALLSGLLIRRLLCRPRGSRVQRRINEAAARAAAKEVAAGKNDDG